MSNNTHRASPLSGDQELLLPKHRNTDSKIRRNVVASLESLAILCTQILDQSLGSLASSLQHRSLLRNQLQNKKNIKQTKSGNTIILRRQVNSSLSINYALPGGDLGNDKGGGIFLCFRDFLCKFIVWNFGSLVIILGPLRFVVFQYNFNNLEMNIQKEKL